MWSVSSVAHYSKFTCFLFRSVFYYIVYLIRYPYRFVYIKIHRICEHCALTRIWKTKRKKIIDDWLNVSTKKIYIYEKNNNFKWVWKRREKNAKLFHFLMSIESECLQITKSRIKKQLKRTVPVYTLKSICVFAHEIRRNSFEFFQLNHMILNVSARARSWVRSIRAEGKKIAFKFKCVFLFYQLTFTKKIDEMNKKKKHKKNSRGNNDAVQLANRQTLAQNNIIDKFIMNIVTSLNKWKKVHSTTGMYTYTRFATFFFFFRENNEHLEKITTTVFILCGSIFVLKCKWKQQQESTTVLIQIDRREKKRSPMWLAGLCGKVNVTFFRLVFPQLFSETRTKISQWKLMEKQKRSEIAKYKCKH